MKKCMTYAAENSFRLFAVLAIAIAVGLGVVDPATAFAGAILLDTTPGDLKSLEAAMEKAFKTMEEGLKKTQDLASNALEESRKYGTLEAKTNDKLNELGAEGKKTSEQLVKLRDEVLELAQKISVKPAGSGAASKAIHEIVAESPQYKAARDTNQMAAVEFPSHLLRIDGSKTQIVNATLDNDQPLVQAQRTPGLIVPAEQRLYIRDLLPQAMTGSNLIEFASEATSTSNARPQGDSSPGGVEGETFAESAMTFSLSNAAVVTMGHWIPASRQVLSDASLLQGHIGARLMYGLKLKEEQDMLTADGSAGKLNGLCNQAAAYSRGVTNDTILDTLLKAMLQVSLSNYEVSGYVLHPVDWYTAMLLKDTQNRYLFSDPQSMVQPRVWAKPVVASQSMTQGKFLAGAFNLGAQIWDRETATIRMSENVASHFIQNMVAILVEERLALTVYRSAAFVYGNTSHAG